MKINDFEKYFNIDTNSYIIPKAEMEAILNTKSKGQSFTENGLKILKAMQEHCGNQMNLFTSKQLGELISLPPRSVSGSLKKLITDGYVEKIVSTPVTYSLTILGKEVQFDKQ